jgi:S-formylglutathione hydrolase FrmB
VASGSVGGFRFNVLLPADYASSGRAYPVLYLFNGTTQNQNAWLANTDLLDFTARLPADQEAIVVMPAGEPGGLNIDWRDGKHPWETAFITHLIPYIETHFRALAGRAHRAIAGLSAGAFTSMHDAARHPDLFAAVGGFSGAVDVTLHSPAGELAWFPFFFSSTLCSGELPTDAGPAGDPVRDDVFWHNANPAEMTENLRGISVYMASGNGVPCDARDIQDVAEAGPLAPLTLIEADIFVFSKGFDRALTDAHVPHTADFYGCGVHTYRYFQRDLHAFWPQMIKAFGTPPPTSFNYRTADATFSVWNWMFTADPRRGAEFLDIHHASRSGLTITGSGTETVTTAALFRPHQRVTVSGAKASSATVRADKNGRITFQVNLGPAHQDQQYTLSARLAGQDRPGYFTTRRVTFRPQRRRVARICRRQERGHCRSQHRPRPHSG